MDFTAVLEQAAAQHTLRIRVVAVGDIPARAALLAQPVIADAVATGELGLEVAAIPGILAHGYVPSPAKRRLRLMQSV
ncbi:MAG: hypothetical protein BWY63_03504 [Chloroflexi bacterium ADurb.Bin360]|nr:MAG: hypothetical protein BWY63_03504 [Chloroflexi bacterium ADurb.Bin360]